MDMKRVEKLVDRFGADEFGIVTISPSFKPDCVAVCSASSFAHLRAACPRFQLRIVCDRPIYALNLIRTGGNRDVHDLLSVGSFRIYLPWLLRCVSCRRI